MKTFAVKLHFLLYGILLILAGLASYYLDILLLLPQWLLGTPRLFPVSLSLYSGLLVAIGSALVLIDVCFLLPAKRRGFATAIPPVTRREMTVALTAYNDEESIADAVADFIRHPSVKRVIVVDNGSRDGTKARAREAGAVVVEEEKRGYGQCVYRCFSECLRCDDTELALICEGDRTFRAKDIDKFLAYIDHAEIVNGTRVVEQLREYETQLTTFMYFGNFFVGKLLEAKYIGKGTFTDVGTTYKLCRTEALKRLMPHLDPRVNLEFNAHFMDKALERNIRLLECPITFFKRVGQSKGGNSGNWRALKVGLCMIFGLLFGWRLIRSRH